MKKVRFGLFYPQVGQSFAQIRERARLAEQLGFDAILFVDHMWICALSMWQPFADHDWKPTAF